jgi:putative modified peptide
MSFQLPEIVADRLLDLLGHDDAYRAMFLANPRLALASIGFEPAADESIREGVWICFTVTTLAPKEVFVDSRSTLRIQLRGEPSYNPIGLGMAAPRTKRQHRELVEV